MEIFSGSSRFHPSNFSVIIGSDTHVGAGTVVKQLIEIGEHVLIGAGSVVVKNIPSNVEAYGNPCKVVK